MSENEIFSKVSLEIGTIKRYSHSLNGILTFNLRYTVLDAIE